MTSFVDRLTEELLKKPSGSHGCLFVVAKDIEDKDYFDWQKKDAYEYQVLGGKHLMLATKKLHEQQPDNAHKLSRSDGQNLLWPQ